MLVRYLTPALICSILAAAGCNSKPQPAATTHKLEVLPPDKKFGLTPEQAQQTLVKVGDTTITLGEFADRLGGQSPYLRARYNSPERRREFLDNMVRFELLATEASKRGFDKSEDVSRIRKQMMVQQMMQELFDKQGLKLSDIGEAEIKSYYEANKSEFDKPAQVRASQIVIKDKAKAEKVLKQLQAKPTDMELFRKLAQENNEDPATKDTYGDLHFFSAEKDATEGDEAPRVPEVRKAAFSLQKVSDLYPELVQTEAGYHIVKLTGKRDAMKRTLEDARRLIQNRLWRQKREEAIEKFVADLRAKADVKENPQLLAKVRVNNKADAAAAKDDDAVGPEGSTKPKADAHAH
ncbi:MAG TPA: peptidyl-prolyl cis-trans isomerase [Polyangiales bacterium]|nr:peptidyl-prolyl cis-trans isomerase [Polyangiales bacterium]